MLYERNFRYLENKRIIYRKYPWDWDDPNFPTGDFDTHVFYPDGTYQCYELFRSKAKINTYKSLKWHLLVLWFLNPSMDQDDFYKLAEHLCLKRNGFTTFNVPTQLLKTIVYEVSMQNLDEPPKNKMRKVIFYDNCMLSTIEKLKIVGSLIGKTKRITADNIYETMLSIHDQEDKITIESISKVLECSPRTIYRNMPEELKREKELLNKEL
jgi:hypothetical protein|tara:strand:+ start:131 stop:763 length:633 start_codon:yes stop_codon:yes gene_type:complete